MKGEKNMVKRKNKNLILNDRTISTWNPKPVTSYRVFATSVWFLNMKGWFCRLKSRRDERGKKENSVRFLKYLEKRKEVFLAKDQEEVNKFLLPSYNAIRSIECELTRLNEKTLLSKRESKKRESLMISLDRLKSEIDNIKEHVEKRKCVAETLYAQAVERFMNGYSKFINHDN